MPIPPHLLLKEPQAGEFHMVEDCLGPGGEIIRVIMLAFARAVFEVLRQRVAEDEQQVIALTLDHTPGRGLRRR